MEAEPSRPADGERPGRQEQQHATAESSLGSCPPLQPQQPPNPRPVHRSLGRLQNRQPKRTDLLLRLQQQQAVAWQHSDTPGTSGGSFCFPTSPSTSSLPSTSSQGEHGHGVPSQSSQENPEVVSSPRKGEKKPQKPGKYVCSYCGRPCAKPSVLQKHIRSHTGERPYPCGPCGFSFKTKSNLYKHRKSHAHRIKAGLASSRNEPSLSGPEGSGVGEEPEEHTDGESTESEEETGQHKKSSSKEMLGHQRKGSKEPLEESQRPEDSQAVKQRLALRLSERKRGPMASPDDPPSSLSTSSSSLGPGSKGSTESGYFSGSGSTDLCQVSPPSASAKTYAEIILGKYGRLGGQQRSPHQQHPHTSLSSSSGTEDKSIPFNVPKTQVIEHITKLITINEAVVDTSEIDSVKPRRSSLSRKSSMESPKFITPKDPYIFDPKGEVPGPSGLRHLHNPEADPLGTQELSAVPLLRCHSMPSPTSQGEQSTSGPMSPRSYRLCQSFDEQQAVVAEMRVGHAQRMLRRQPAIEVPLGAEVMLEEASPTSSYSARQPQQQQQQPRSPSLFVCEACGAPFQHSDLYDAHRGICPGRQKVEQKSRDVGKTSREDRPPMMMHYKFRALAMAVRKRRKEESLEEDPPSPGSVAISGSSTGLIPMSSRPEHGQVLSGVPLQTDPKPDQDRKGVSVIQHTSSFEKQESISTESQEADLKESQQRQQPEPKPSPTTSRLIRQRNIQVPEILVTVEPDADMPSVSPPVTASSSKEAERVEEFQWPQRSETLAKLPAEKLPPKKKRLRLAEAAQSSGESSFESVSLPRSPSQESNISHTSSLSASFEETARSDSAIWASSSQSSQMLMVPSASHQHHQSQKEMRRSASEQTPPSPQQTEQISETRSKSFDYGSLSPQQSSSSWKERRKCLLVKHATLGEPEQEEGTNMSHLSRAESPKPGPSHSIHLPPYSTEASSCFNPEAAGKALQLLPRQIFPPSQDMLLYQPSGQQRFPQGQLSQLLPVSTGISDVLSTQIIHRAFLHSQTGPPPIQLHPAQIHMAEQLGIPFPQLPALVPLQFSSRTRANQALCLPLSSRLTTQVPSIATTESRPAIAAMSSALPRQALVRISYHHPRPVIATCLAQLTPLVSIVVPVRLQTHMPTYANAMYTTLSQILASTCSQGPISCTAMVIMGQVERNKLQRSYLKVPSPDFKSLLSISLPTEMASGSGEGYGPLGAGGSKRMLSPAASLELSTEAQRHQKRVKEEGEKEQHKAEEEGDEEEEDNVVQKFRQEKANEKNQEVGEEKQAQRVEFTAVKVEGQPEQVPRTQYAEEKKKEEGRKESTSQKKEGMLVVKEGIKTPSIPSYPSLDTSTSVNWCYLNYVKPNPSALSDPCSSVYSTWSVSAHNPNLPGLSTKSVLSLLCSKQKHSSETYTMATAPTLAKSQLAPASSSTSRVSEVHATPASTLARVKDEQQHEKEEKKETTEEEPSTSKHSEVPRVRIFEGGYKSNEEYVYVRGRGRGKYICGECGIRCKKPSMLKKHIRTHTDVRPYVCKHCNFAFKTKGNLTKHMKSKAHGKKCQAMGVSESSLDEPESEETAGSDERVCGSEEQEGHQFSDVDESEDDDDNDDDEEEEEESASHDDPPSSCSSDTHQSTGGHSWHSQQGTPEAEPLGTGLSPGQEPSHRGVWPRRRATSPGSRRALFSRRGWKASPRGFSPSSESCSPSRSLSPRLELSSPIHSFSPRTELSSPSQHISPSPERGPSPIRPLSPLRPISPSCHRSSHARTLPSPLGFQHRTPGYMPWETPGTKRGHVRQDKSGTEGPTLPESSLFPPSFRLSTCEGYPGLQTVDTTFSHLPMHSQQARVPYPMIPIGGIQILQARPRSHPTTPSSPTSPPMEGPSFARFESYWGGTPRTQGLRTPGDPWSEHQAAGTSQPVRCVYSTAFTCSKQVETTDSKQYGSSHGSVYIPSSAGGTPERGVRDSRSSAPPSVTAPVASRLIGQLPEGEEPQSGGGMEKQGAKGERTDQST
ncbi:transcription factor HIVEP3 isoform X1 [Notolabrus celidotus]|uniref:transcription factor HIVEP3 isoform X1 n=1 Tax=Notolabrus celidotus TaxID=1203425 RepID=UPI0014903F00|nr:transcription factor HIVEP3 isoform X1 [Notolabrus celidotus]XP_034554600.1 transcription factor HIVEP3 isoform X1 [Notolabrus celidotus]XP_034554601.1 transcription factor HIVEP3 isoform X1 [Notolabrus celidotus]XP_034554602.1 transcription factor HIVEP3 isoform X1 [Notolabrus celidotus]XP_034554603.1 transcription factor HIVEP3 isoform X1 [Notolabrus celidotus]